MSPQQSARYLGLLGLERREPSYAALAEIVHAHVVRIPFENISKLHYRKHLELRGIPVLDLFLDGIERYRFGGTCYACNFHLYELLDSLGYDAKLCGADMSKPDVHMVTLVTLEGREYLVDGGNAAPFLEPLPRDLLQDHVVALGRDRYVLRPRDSAGRSQMDLYRDGVYRLQYTVNPRPRRVEEFGGVIADSYRDDATFMNALLLVRFQPGQSVMIHNLTVIESGVNGTYTRKLGGREDVANAVQELFGIPGEVVAGVVGELAELQDVWG